MSQGIFITSCGSLVSHCSPRGHTCFPGGEAVALWSGPLPLMGCRHMYVGNPLPFPGLPWDTDQNNPFPLPHFSSISQQPPTSQTEGVLSTGDAIDGVFAGNISFQGITSGKGYYGQALPAAGLLSSLHSGPILPGGREAKAERRGKSIH